MGSLLGPVLTNLIFGYHEKIWLDEFKSREIILYPRYVDGIICLFSCENIADKFFTFVNSRHPNIKNSLSKRKRIIK